MRRSARPVKIMRTLGAVHVVASLVLENRTIAFGTWLRVLLDPFGAGRRFSESKEQRRPLFDHCAWKGIVACFKITVKAELVTAVVTQNCRWRFCIQQLNDKVTVCAWTVLQLRMSQNKIFEDSFLVFFENFCRSTIRYERIVHQEIALIGRACYHIRVHFVGNLNG